MSNKTQGNTMNKLNLSTHPDDDFDPEDDDYYDDEGRISSGGIYDAGGNAITERYLDYADMLYDRMKDRE
jgi:hypothetical protein